MTGPFGRGSAGRLMPEAIVFPNTLLLQQLDIVEQKAATQLQRHRARPTTVQQILRLRQNPDSATHRGRRRRLSLRAEVVRRSVQAQCNHPIQTRNCELFGHVPDKFPTAVPLHDCFAVLPWIVTAAAPASSTRLATSGAVISSSSHPLRIFTVTGIFTALTIAATTAAA